MSTSSTPDRYTYANLKEDMQRGIGTIRMTADLVPKAGEGTVIAPPTYASDDDSKKPKSAFALTAQDPNDPSRYQQAIIQSIAAGANAHEAALRRLHIEENKLPELPYYYIEYAGTTETIDAYQLPHRAYDGILRDAVDANDTLFRFTPPGQAITAATAKSATMLLKYAPLVLLFGGWDSHGPKGAEVSAKIERAIADEIVAYGVTLAATGGGGRRDPLNISSDINLAENTDDKAKTGLQWRFRSGSGKGLKPSNFGHGAPPPHVNHAGGVIADKITHHATLSYAVLGKLHFPLEGLTPVEQAKVDQAGRAVIAALGLVSMAARAESQYALRSRCDLIPRKQIVWEWLGATLEDTRPIVLSVDDAIAIFQQAVKDAAAVGLVMDNTHYKYTPHPSAVELLTLSRKAQAAKNADA